MEHINDEKHQAIPHVQPASPGSSAEPTNGTSRNPVSWGAKWAIGGQSLVAAVQLAQIAVLARLLTAADFGAGAIYLLLVGLGQLWWDFGTSAAVIQRRDATREQLSALYWLNISLAALFAGALWVCAPSLAALFDGADLTALFRWPAATAIIAAFGGQYRALRLKALQLKAIALIDAVSAIAACGAATLAAYNDMGPYTFVVATIVSATTTSLLLTLSGMRFHRPRMTFRASGLRVPLRFGAYQTGSSLINFTHLNLDVLILSGFLGMADLGLYSFAKQLCVRPLEIFYPIFVRSVLPQLAFLQDDSTSFRRYFVDALRILNAAYIPLFACLIVTAHVLIPSVFGEHWKGAISVFQVLAVAHVSRFLMVPTSVALMAKGEVHRGFYWDLVTSCLLLTSVLLFHKRGVTAIAAAVLAVYVLVLIPHWWLLVRTSFGIRFKVWAGAALRPILASVGAAALAGSIGAMLSMPLANLTVTAAVGLFVYAALSFWINEPTVDLFRRSR